MPPLQRPLALKFWNGVNKNGPIHPTYGQCWLFENGLRGFGGGYGWLWHDKKGHRANRISWLLHYGPIPDGLWVLHRCDNPPCIRPTYLFIGTGLDNNRDTYSKGRQASVCDTKHIGEENGRAILSETSVIEILQWPYSYSGKLRELSDILGISMSTIQAIRSGRLWKQLYEYHSKFGKRNREGKL